jgi:signal transduction histidine kinase
MLDEFLITNRQRIIERTRLLVAARGGRELAVSEQTANGVPAFLDQLVTALRLSRSNSVADHAQIAKSGAQHGEDLLRSGLTIAQVVRDYGDVCQSVTELVIEQAAVLSAEEFQTLNLCLDDATAAAVTAYENKNRRASRDQGTERLGVLAHEMRNLLNTAVLALESIKSGRVAAGGSTGLLLGRSLLGLRDLIDRSLAEVRLDAGIEHTERIVVSELLAELEIGSALEAQAREIRLVVVPVHEAVAIHGDRALLTAALANLLQNAFKFTHKRGRVSLTTIIVGERVLFQVEDECGGLPAGLTEKLFAPFEQHGKDKSGLGLGLAICSRAARANGGELHARDLPGKGCVFTLDLPVHHPETRGESKSHDPAPCRP